jgi:hypothetical protein
MSIATGTDMNSKAPKPENAPICEKLYINKKEPSPQERSQTSTGRTKGSRDKCWGGRALANLERRHSVVRKVSEIRDVTVCASMHSSGCNTSNAINDCSAFNRLTVFPDCSSRRTCLPVGPDVRQSIAKRKKKGGSFMITFGKSVQLKTDRDRRDDVGGQVA